MYFNEVLVSVNNFHLLKDTVEEEVVLKLGNLQKFFVFFNVIMTNSNFKNRKTKNSLFIPLSGSTPTEFLSLLV